LNFHSCPVAPDASQRGHQHVGEGREPQSQLIGAHRRRAGAACEQVGLAFLDAVSISPRAQYAQ